MEDILELSNRIQQLEMELESQKKKYEIIRDYSNCALWEYEIEQKRLVLSRKLDGQWNNTNMVIENYQQAMHKWGLVHPDDWDIFDAYCRSMDRGEEKFQYDVRQVTDEAVFAWLRYIGMAVYDKNHRPVKIVGKTMDVSWEKKEKEELLERASKDSLTGIYNKETTRNMIEKYLNSPAAGEEGGAFVIVDLDDFKQVNDTWGHLYGDLVLTRVANVLTTSAFQNDIVGRIGGDEFVVFLKGKSIVEEIREYADRLMFKAANAALKHSEGIGISAGIALFPKNASTYTTLYQSADMALYKAKKLGKNKYCFYEKRLNYKVRIGESTGKRDAVEAVGGAAKGLSKIEKELFDYSFAAVSACEDMHEAIRMIFTEIGIYFKLNMIELISFQKHEGRAKLLQSWQESGQAEEPGETERFYMKYWKQLESYYRQHEILIYEVGNEEEAISFLKQRERESFIQIPVFDGMELIYLISYHQNGREWVFHSGVSNTLNAITKMLASYLLRLNLKKEMELENRYMEYSLSGHRMAYYVIDPDDYRLIYAGSQTREMFAGSQSGTRCYELLMGRREPCTNCLLEKAEAGRTMDAEVHNDRTGRNYHVTVQRLQTREMREQILFSWLDISDFSRYAGTRDELTGTYKYDGFRRELGKRIADSSGKYALALFGIREFAKLNEVFGFEMGDRLLKDFACHIRRSLADGELVCRIKGDDFMVLLDEDVEQPFEWVNHSMVTFAARVADNYPDVGVNLYAGIYHIRETDCLLNEICDRVILARKKVSSKTENQQDLYEY